MWVILVLCSPRAKHQDHFCFPCLDYDNEQDESVGFMTLKVTPRLGFEPKHPVRGNRSRADRI